MSVEKATEICIEMLRCRNYDFVDIVESEYLLFKNSDDDSIILFNNVDSFDTKNMKSIYLVMNTNQINHSIVIYKDKVTSMAKSSIENFDLEIELFNIQDLQYNILKHCLQPKSFEKLSIDEIKKINQKIDLKFPIMRESDPVSRFLNFKAGNIIKIVRKNDFVSYRIVRK